MSKKKSSQNEHFSNVDSIFEFSTPTLSPKIENINLKKKKRKPMCTTTMSLVFKFI